MVLHAEVELVRAGVKVPPPPSSEGPASLSALNSGEPKLVISFPVTQLCWELLPNITLCLAGDPRGVLDLFTYSHLLSAQS